MTDLSETVVENRWMVQPNHANNLGTAHGGNVLKWMDEVGAMSAMRFAGATCVTVHMDEVNFRRPIPVGDIALARGYVYDTGQSSVRVRMQVYRENPRTGRTEPTTESYMVFVAIDADREPTTVPELVVTTEEERALLEAAFEHAPD